MHVCGVFHTLFCIQLCGETNTPKNVKLQFYPTNMLQICRKMSLVKSFFLPAFVTTLHFSLMDNYCSILLSVKQNDGFSVWVGKTRKLSFFCRSIQTCHFFLTILLQLLNCLHFRFLLKCCVLC